MKEQEIEKMDQEWMRSTKDIREKKVSDGMLKGFSASVERRILAKEQSPAPARAFSWVPAMAVLVIASVVVLRSPMVSQPTAFIQQPIEYAQLNDTDNIDDEIAALKEVGAWSDADDALLGASDEAGMEDLELSNLGGTQTSIA
jgi:hypothetical protein